MANSIYRTLTEEVCDRGHMVADRDTSKEFWIRDRRIRGLALKVTPEPYNSKSFTLDYCIRETGIAKRHTIGRYQDPISVKDARIAAMLLKTDISNGHYPTMQKKTLMVRDIMDYYLRHKGYDVKSQPHSVNRRYIEPSIGKVSITHLTSQQVHREADAAAERGGYSVRNHYLSYLSAAWSLAQANLDNMTVPNPVHGLKHNKIKSGAKTMSPEQYAALFAALDKMHKESRFNKHTLLAIEMVAYAGNRKEEISNIKLADIDARAKVIYIDKHKTVDRDMIRKVIHITEPVQSIITRARALRMEQGVTEADNPYLFISPRSKTVYASMGLDAWREVQRLCDGLLDGYSIKHLRSGLTSVGRSVGMTDEMIAGVTQHSDPSTVTKSYARNLTEDVIANTNKIASIIASYRR